MNTHGTPFRVPLGVTETGDLIAGEDADRARTYRCPGCGDALLLKAGEIRARHFAHSPNASCSRESALHALGKLVVA